MLQKALSLWQPWASLMFAPMAVRKRFETRGWSTILCGPLLVHAAAKRPDELLAWLPEFSTENLLWAAVAAMVEAQFMGRAIEVHCNPHENPAINLLSCLPRGCVIGRVTLIDVVPTHIARRRQDVSPTDLALGDFSDGRFAWECTDACRFEAPMPLRGRQRLFNVDINQVPA